MAKKTKSEVVAEVIGKTRAHTVELFANMIEEKGLKWVCEWDKGTLNFKHENGKTHTRYNGMNIMHLAAVAYENGYEDTRWFTFKQAKEKGYAPRKGETSATVEYWKLIEGEKTVEDEEGNETKEKYAFWRPVGWFNVFNAEQLVDEEGKPMTPEKKQPKKRLNKELCEIADHLIETSRCAVNEVRGGGGAWYEPGADVIRVPNRRKFKTMKNFIATLTHEMAHSTMKPLNRTEARGNRFGSKKYAYEELVAELGSVFVCQHLGVQRAQKLEHDKNFANHAAYLQNWLEVIRKDNDALFNAATAASKAADYIIERYEGKDKVEQAA